MNDLATSSGSPPAATLTGLLAPVTQAWKGLAARERRAVAIAGLLIGIALVWMILIQPALRTVRTAPAQIDALDIQLQRMQGLAAESRELRGSPTVAPAQATVALRAATDRLGEHARLTLLSDRGTLTLSGVEAGPLAAWLGEARSAARARPIDAQLTRGPQGYAGTVVVQLGGAP